MIKELELPTINEYFILENKNLQNPAIGNVSLDLKAPTPESIAEEMKQTLDQDLIALDKQIISFSPEFIASGVGVGHPPNQFKEQLFGGQQKMQSLPGDAPKKKKSAFEIPTADPKNPPGAGAPANKKKKQGPVGQMPGAGSPGQKKKTIGAGASGKKQKSTIY